jgi:hypothetical protein
VDCVKILVGKPDDVRLLGVVRLSGRITLKFTARIISFTDRN